MTTTPISFSTVLRHFVSIALLFLAAGNLYAQQALSISLKGSAEVPPVTTTASGNSQITVQPNRSISGTIMTSGMTPTMAHIHEGPPGRNGPPIITLTMNSDGSFAVPDNTMLSDTQYASYLAGNLYINVHSKAFPGGEIRGQFPGAETATSPMRPAY